MRRASARSSRSGDTASSTSATRSMPSRSRLTSRRISAARMSTTAACWIGSSRPTAPKSMSPSVPSSNTKMLPGMRVGVEEADPQHLVERGAQQLLGERVAVDARRVEPLGVGDGEALEALLHEEPAGAELACRPSGPGPPSRDRAAAPSRAIASASRRKSSSARRLSRELVEHLAGAHALAERRAPLRDVGEERERGEVALRSRPAMPGRCTFTTTASPVRSRARYVWPIDAAASGSQSNSANTRSTLSPSSASSTWPDRVDRLRGRPGSAAWRARRRPRAGGGRRGWRRSEPSLT